MKKIVTLIAFVVGAAAGAAVTYYVQKDISDKNKDIFYENEVKPAREDYLAKSKELELMKKELIDTNRNLKEKYDDLNKELGYVKGQVVEKATEVKESIEEKVDSSISAAKTLIDDFKETVMTKLDANGPNAYFIDLDDYNSDNNGYHKVPVVYYLNQVAVDKDYNLIDDFDEMIGRENLAKLSELMDKKGDIAWIRNDDISTDFEIQLADYDFND